MKGIDQIPQHVSVLRREFEARAGRNAGYSLRAFARDLDLSPAALSSLLNLKKGVSEERAKDIADRIALSRQESEFFVLSARSSHARAERDRTEATGKLASALSAKSRRATISNEQFAQIPSWIHLTILELLDVQGCEHTPEWFASKLGLSVRAVKVALERLLALQLLCFEQGRYQAVTEETTTEMDVPSSAVRDFHSEILGKAGQALFRDTVQEREFLSATFAFSTKELKEAKEAIRKFQKEFSERFYSNRKKKDSVYQISVQFFRLDQKKEGTP